MPSRSESAPDWPAPRARPMASISSKKMIAPLSLRRAWAKRSRTREAPTPTKVSTKSEPERAKNGTPLSPATALASSVLPVPGGPCSTTPRGIRAPTRRKRSGSSRKTTTSRSSSTASSQPATSAKRVRGGSTWALRRILPWPAAPPRPPRPRPPGLRPRIRSMPPTTKAITSAKPSGSSRKRTMLLIPEPEPAGSAAGPRTATPALRSRAARSNAPGSAPDAAPRSGPAPVPAGAAGWAKSRPALGLGMDAAMTLPWRSTAATQKLDVSTTAALRLRASAAPTSSR